VGADDEDRFFIKPYNMELDELRHFRKLFDQMQFFSDDAKQANLKQVVGG
jgi:hypothetical protein